MKFGEYLVSLGAITQAQVDETLSVQRFRGVRFGRLLVELGYLDKKSLDQNLRSYLKPSELGSVTQVLELIKNQSFPDGIVELSKKLNVILFEVSPTSIVVISTKFSDTVIESMEREFGCECEISLLGMESFQWLSNALNGESEATQIDLIVEADGDDKNISPTDPFTSVFRDMIVSAREMKASDIHIQPEEKGVDIRFRVFGELYTWKSLGFEYRQSFVNEAKKLSNLSIAVSGVPQDGRMYLKEWHLRIRVNLVPTQYGEKIVMRLFDLTRSFCLDGVGFERDVLCDLQAAISAKNGVVIISGPTGSGKSTTLFSLLNEIDQTKKNLVTIENPIEYSFGGISQIEVTRLLSFSDALRAVLRQDPDVILLGEIRDRETANLCAQAAATGHLVLSTLHANSASEVVGRLLNLGVEPYMIRSCLKLSAAQRLVQKLCPACSKPADSALVRLLGGFAKERRLTLTKNPDFRTKNKEGCSSCVHGTIGRIPLLEYVGQDEVGKQLDSSSTEAVYPKVSLTKGALRAAQRGETDIREVMDVA